MLRVRLAYISGGFPIWPLEIARDRGLFGDAGIALEVTHTGSSTVQMEGLRRGSFDIGLQLPDHVIRAALTGLPMQILGAQTHAPDVALVGRPDVLELSGLRARPIAVDGAKTGYALLLRKLLLDNGFADDEIVLVEVGDSARRVQALESGELAAAFVNPPLDRGLIARGFKRLTSTREAFPTYPGPVVAARSDWITSHRDTVRAFQRIWGNAWSWLLDPMNAEAAIRLAADKLQADGPSAARALEALRTAGKPTIGPVGLRVVLDLVAEGQARSLSVETLLV